MNTIEYTYILKVAEEGSIQKAADILFVSTSTISKCIAKYDKKYNVKLFEYDGKQMQLTRAGTVFADHIRKILAIDAGMESEMSDLANYYSGKIRIGMPLNYNSDVANSAVIAFKNRYPLITVSITKGDNTRIEHKLLSGEVDIAFDLKTKNLGILSSIPLYEEELALLVPENHPLVHSAVQKDGFFFPWIDFSETANEHFISLPPETRTEQFLEQMSHEAGFKPFRAITVTTVREAQECAARQLGISLRFASPKYTKINGCTTLSIGPAPVRQMHTITYRKDFFFNEDVRDFIRIYEDFFGLKSCRE